MNKLELTPAEIAMIQGEEETLAKILTALEQQERKSQVFDLAEQSRQIKQQMAESRDDDYAQLGKEYDRLNDLISRMEKNPLQIPSKQSPYFAHVRLIEQGKSKDLYLGSSVFLAREASAQIIDWRASPISAVYYGYEDGEEYDEEIEGRLFSGKVDFKRILTIQDSTLLRIEEKGHAFVKFNGQWQPQPMANTQTQGAPSLGSGAGRIQRDKSLSALTGLIDPAQYQLITSHQNGIMAIEGTAGSGKTTVALHRMAWLMKQNPERFAPYKMGVILYSRALARYIAKVLPSLDASEVKVDSVESWMLRNRRICLANRFGNQRIQNPPVASIKLKRHPTLVKMIRAFIEQRSKRFNQIFDELDQKGIISQRLEHGFKDQPLISRAFALKKRFRGNRDPMPPEIAAGLARLQRETLGEHQSRIEVLFEMFDDFFTNFKALRQDLSLHTAQILKPGELAEAFAWLSSQYQLRQAALLPREKSENTPLEPALDEEDDALLLFFFQGLIGPIPKKKGGSALNYGHLFIDEAQDLSSVEIQVLIDPVQTPKSITFAGDANQKIIEHSGFESFEALFKGLGLEGGKVNALKAAYRSTRQIMDFSFALLGKHAKHSDYRTVREGPEVACFRFGAMGESAHFIGRHLKALAVTEPDALTAVSCPDQETARLYYDLFKKMNLPRCRLILDEDFEFSPGIEVALVDQLKGLEFDYVILTEVDRTHYPADSYHRKLLHMGATRAAYQLWVCSSGPYSPILPDSYCLKE